MNKRFLQDILSKDELSRLYYEEGKTVTEIGKMFGFVNSAVLRLMDKYELPRRKRTLRSLVSKEELNRLYHAEGKTIKEIGDMFGFVDSAVLKLMDSYKISRRKRRTLMDILSREALCQLYYEEQKTAKEIGEIYSFNDSAVFKLMETYELPRRKKRTLKDELSKDELSRLYYDERKTGEEIGKLFGFNCGAVYKLMEEYDLPKRKSHDYMNQIKHKLTKEKMYELYVEKEKTSSQIAEEYNSSPSYVLGLLKEYGIKRRVNSYYKNTISKQLSKEELNRLLFVENLTYQQIADKFNVKYKTIIYLAGEYSITVRDVPFREKLSKEELIKLYIEQRLNAKDIAKLYNVTPSTILNLIDEYGIEKRSKSEAFHISNQKNPNVDVDFFKELSPELAYILGLWASDGNVNNQGNIALSLIDKEVVEWVAETINCKNPVKETFIEGRRPFYTVHFSNPIVKEIFAQYGIVENKTHILVFPDLPKEFIPYFIRGFFEGDGSISVGTTKRGHLEQNVTFGGASLTFMKKLKSVIESIIGGNRKLSNAKDYNNERYKRDFYIYTFGGREDVIKFGDWIYGGKLFGMKRKYKEFEFLKHYVLQNNKKKEKAIAMIIEKGEDISKIKNNLMEEGLPLSLKEIVTKEILSDLYWNQNKNLYQIAEMYDTGVPSVFRLMEEWEIPRRDFKYRSKFTEVLTKDTLHQLYWEEGLTLKQIGDKYETDAPTIFKYMEKFKIPRRQNISKLADLTKEELHRLHWEEKLTLKEIGDRYNTVNTNVLKLMKKWKIPRRKRSASVLANLQHAISSSHGKCLDPENYNGTRKELLWECSNSHTFKRTPREILDCGKWCPECHGEEKILKNNHK